MMCDYGTQIDSHTKNNTITHELHIYLYQHIYIIYTEIVYDCVVVAPYLCTHHLFKQLLVAQSLSQSLPACSRPYTRDPTLATRVNIIGACARKHICV